MVQRASAKGEVQGKVAQAGPIDFGLVHFGNGHGLFHMYVYKAGGICLTPLPNLWRKGSAASFENHENDSKRLHQRGL